MLKDSDKPQLGLGFRFQWEPVQDCHVLLYPEGMVQLSPSAAAVLELCDGTRAVGEIIEGLRHDFPDDDITDDVREFLEEARAQGWIVPA